MQVRKLCATVVPALVLVPAVVLALVLVPAVVRLPVRKLYFRATILIRARRGDAASVPSLQSSAASSSKSHVSHRHCI